MEGSALGPADYVDPELMQVASKVLRDAMFEFKSRKVRERLTAYPFLKLFTE